jgi:hypothetical protein
MTEAVDSLRSLGMTEDVIPSEARSAKSRDPLGYREVRLRPPRFFDAVFRPPFFAADLRPPRFAPPFFALRLRGTLAPFSRASLRPIAIACSLLFTFRPLRPLFSVSFLRRRIALATRLLALLPYLRPLDFFFAAIDHSPRTGGQSHRGARPGAR